MKHVTLLVAFLALGTFVSAQTYYRVGYLQTWDGAEWYDSLRMTHEFTDMLNRGHILDERLGADWRPRTRTIFSYDDMDRIDSLSILQWDIANTQWVNDELKTTLYNVDDQAAEHQVNVWNGSAWDPVERYVYDHDGSPYLMETLSQVWVGTWEDRARTVYSYDGNGNRLVARDDSLDVNMEWTTYSIDSMTYNGLDQEIMKAEWTDFLGDMIPVSLIETTYDTDGEIETRTTTLLFPFPEGFPIIHEERDPAGDGLLNQLFLMNNTPAPDGPIWELNFQWIYDAEPVMAVGEPNGQDVFRVYPNPATDMVTVATDVSGPLLVSLWNNVGQQVGVPRRISAAERTTFDLRSAAPGMYLVEVLSSAGVQRRAVIISR